MYMIHEGAKLFDELIVAIGINPDKQYTFSLEERLAFLGDCTRGIAHVKLEHFTNMFLVDYAKKIGASHILRGIRNPNDYEYERGMRHINSDLNAQIVTVFLIPPREIAEVSSSFVKGLVGPKGWRKIVKEYLPHPVYDAFLRHYSNDRGEAGGLREMSERA
jgi:pantetheine-phosphate adenylyltransferase